MKLLLSDGTAIAVTSYEKTNTTVNGNTVDAVSIVVEKTTLEKVKTMFNDSDNLGVMHMYNNENILVDTFNGYQIRKSIALGDVDTSFVVLLAKSSEVNEQIAAMSNEIDAIKKELAELTNSVSDVVKTSSETANNTDDAIKKYNEQSKALQSITEAVNEMKESVSDQKTNVDNLEIAVKKMKEAFTSFAETAETIGNRYASMTEGINTTNQNVSRVLSEIDGAYNTIVSKADEFSHLSALIKEIKELATSNDNKVLSFGENVNVLTEGVNGAKLAVEQFSEDVTAVTKNAKDAKEAATKASETANKALESVGTTKESLTELTKKAEENANTTTSLEERIATLEPVEDYTTLSLDDAKKYRINESKLKLATYLEEHPVTSSCHGGEAAQYSITSEKQSFLQAMIAMTTIAEASGLEYQPSWNRVGESCTYDWTLTELQQLAIEIEAVVRPLVSHQQALEKEILNVSSMSALKAVDISYDAIDPNEIVKKITE